MVTSEAASAGTCLLTTVTNILTGDKLSAGKILLEKFNRQKPADGVKGSVPQYDSH